MRDSRRHARRVGSRLFLIYAVASLVPVVVLGFVLYRGYRQDGIDRAIDQGRAQAAVIEQMAIAPALGRRDLGMGLPTAARDHLLDATALSLFSGSVVRLRVRSFAGRVVFSDDGSIADAMPASDPSFRAATAGRTAVALVPDPTGAGGQVLRVLLPIVPNASGQATGVLEVYLPYAPIARTVDAQLRRAALRLAGVLAALYVVLALISWSSTRRLRRHAADRAHDALTDSLTGLPNREWFRSRAEEAVRDSTGAGHGAIVLVDLDRFKEVNDTLGHHAGDELLCVVAHRLAAALRTDDLVARLGGDEFGLVLPHVESADQALELLERIRERLEEPLTLESVELRMEASFGVALYPAHGTCVEDLLKRADAAMYEGKRGTSPIVVHDAAAAAQSPDRLVVLGQLRHALDRDELVLHYQPKIDLATGAVHSVEALLRWQHPRRGLLGPGEFIGIAEQSGLIGPLTEWVLRRALADHRDWTAAGVHWPVSVNVSARNLEAADFPALVTRVLEDSDATAHDLNLELTETALAGDAPIVVDSVSALAARGIRVAVDDFGTGYASLVRLRSLAVSEVKIDRAFVMDLEHNGEDRSIVRSIIDLAHGLGCSVTAEGVETPDVAGWLRNAGCDLAQGYRFARPAPWTELPRRFDIPATRSAPTIQARA